MLADKKVHLYMEVTSRGHVDDLDDLVRDLSAHGIAEEDAECLIAFVPMAFARVLLAPQGVKFQTTFLVKDFETGASVRGDFANEPIHVAAIEVAKAMASGDADSRVRFEQMAATSAEYDVVRQLRPEGGSPDGIVLTEACLPRVPVAHVKAATPGRMRRLWRNLLGA